MREYEKEDKDNKINRFKSGHKEYNDIIVEANINS